MSIMIILFVLITMQIKWTHFVFIEHSEHQRCEFSRITLREKLSVYFYEALKINNNHVLKNLVHLVYVM